MRSYRRYSAQRFELFLMIDRFRKVHNACLARWKWLLSFRKSEWTLDDYPVVFRKHKHEMEQTPSRLKPVAFSAAIANWWALSGGGDTAEEAICDLKTNFARQALARRQRGEAMPRPGTHVPLEFASTKKIDKYGEIADDFIRRVLELEWAWISDESSLWDFHHDQTNEALVAKIKQTYGVDVSDIESARLHEIFERIASHGTIARPND